MSQSILFASTKDMPAIARALDSELRCRMLQLLQNSSMNIKQLSEQLDIPQSTCTVNIQILEKANLIQTEQTPAKSHGSQKVCTLKYEKVMLPVVSRDEYRESNQIETEMPIGLFSDFQVSAPCGLVSESEVIGHYDSIASFLHPSRASAGLIWFSHGYLEYRFPKNFTNDSSLDEMEVSAELCSEYPGHRDVWPSDITLWVNGQEAGTWTAPGDMGGKRGLLTPSWWNTNDTQSGFLKTWRITGSGTYMEGKQISGTRIADLLVHQADSITIRIGVKEQAHNRGGLNIFGEKFGNHPQDIKVVVKLLSP